MKRSASDAKTRRFIFHEYKLFLGTLLDDWEMALKHDCCNSDRISTSFIYKLVNSISFNGISSVNE